MNKKKYYWKRDDDSRWDRWYFQNNDITIGMLDRLDRFGNVYHWYIHPAECKIDDIIPNGTIEGLRKAKNIIETFFENYNLNNKNE